MEAMGGGGREPSGIEINRKAQGRRVSGLTQRPHVLSNESGHHIGQDLLFTRWRQRIFEIRATLGILRLIIALQAGSPGCQDNLWTDPDPGPQPQSLCLLNVQSLVGTQWDPRCRVLNWQRASGRWLVPGDPGGRSKLSLDSLCPRSLGAQGRAGD